MDDLLDESADEAIALGKVVRAELCGRLAFARVSLEDTSRLPLCARFPLSALLSSHPSNWLSHDFLQSKCDVSIVGTAESRRSLADDTTHLVAEYTVWQNPIRVLAGGRPPKPAARISIAGSGTENFADSQILSKSRPCTFFE